MEAGIYKHYKGGYYQVLGVAAHTETNEEMVVYISLDATQPGPRMRVRPRQSFEGKVYSRDFEPVKRFTYIGNQL